MKLVRGGIRAGEAATVAALRLGRHRSRIWSRGQGAKRLHRGGGHRRIQKVSDRKQEGNGPLDERALIPVISRQLQPHM